MMDKQMVNSSSKMTNSCKIKKVRVNNNKMKDNNSLIKFSKWINNQSNSRRVNKSKMTKNFKKNSKIKISKKKKNKIKNKIKGNNNKNQKINMNKTLMKNKIKINSQLISASSVLKYNKPYKFL